MHKTCLVVVVCVLKVYGGEGAYSSCRMKSSRKDRCKGICLGTRRCPWILNLYLGM